MKIAISELINIGSLADTEIDERVDEILNYKYPICRGWKNPSEPAARPSHANKGTCPLPLPLPLPSSSWSKCSNDYESAPNAQKQLRQLLSECLFIKKTRPELRVDEFFSYFFLLIEFDWD